MLMNRGKVVKEYWVLFNKPQGFREKIIALKFEITKDAAKATSEAYAADTVDEIRLIMETLGKTNKVERDPSDDPEIIEAWY